MIIDIEGAELDFLEKADLSGIRGIVIEFHPKIYQVAGMRHCKSLLRAQGFDRGPGSTVSVWAAVRTPAEVRQNDDGQLPWAEPS
jgi:hypothetical protein